MRPLLLILMLALTLLLPAFADVSLAEDGPPPREGVVLKNQPQVIQECRPPRADLSLPRDVIHVLDAVVIIQNRDKVGSGVLISPEGYILTVAHVLEGGGNQFAVHLKSGETQIGRLIRLDTSQDIALLKIDGDIQNLQAHCLPIQRKAPIIGSEVFGVGVSLANNWALTMQPAQVEGYRTRRDGASYIQTATDMAPGYSGGPLLNKQGEIVGLVSWKMSLSPSDTRLFSALVKRAENAMRLNLQ